MKQLYNNNLFFHFFAFTAIGIPFIAAYFAIHYQRPDPLFVYCIIGFSLINSTLSTINQYIYLNKQTFKNFHIEVNATTTLQDLQELQTKILNYYNNTIFLKRSDYLEVLKSNILYRTIQLNKK